MKPIAATSEQRQAAQRRLSKGELSELSAHFLAHRRDKAGNVSPSDRTAANVIKVADVSARTAKGVAPDALVAAVGRVREAKASMALHSQPRGGKHVFSHEPTPERRRQAAHGIEAETVVPGQGPVADTNRHRIVDYVARIKKDLAAEEVAVLDWVLDLAEAHVMTNVTINYGGASGGGNPGRKLGGLGNVSQAVRDKHRMFQLIRAAMHPGFLKTLEDMVLQLRLDDKPITAQEFAARLFPDHKDKSFRQGVTMAAVKTLAWRLIEIQWRERALTRGTPAIENGE